MELNKIYCGDNLLLLEQLAKTEIKVDLILSDPPYNVGKNFGNDSDNLAVDTFLERLNERLIWLNHVTAPGAGMIWFASYRYVAEIILLLKKHSLYYQRQMIWHYRNGMSRQVNSPVTEYEPFLWFTFSNDLFTYNADDVRIPYRSERVKNPVYKTNKDGQKKAWLPDPRGAKRGDVWEYPALAGKNFENERTDHPTQKPEELITELIKAFCPKKDGKYDGVVLDPYAGSGTTCVCCEKLNRLGNNIRYLGFELEPRWVDVGRRRIEDITSYIL